jgi:hypothetical protein
MHCTFVRTSTGGAVLCGPKRIPRCAFCHGVAGLECDFPTTPRKTCDKKICRGCAIAIGPNVDFCPDHPLPASQLSLELG